MHSNYVFCEDELEFADSLYRAGEYDRAITEYLRYKFRVGDQETQIVDYKIALCYERLNKHEKAIETLNKIYTKRSTFAEQALMDIGLIYYREKRFSNSIDEFNEYIKNFPNGQLNDDAQYMIAVALIENGDLEEAKNTLSAISKEDGAFKNSADDILVALDKREVIKYKSVGTAGTLSAVLPGAGQFYVGRNADGAAALLMNSAVAGGAILSFFNDEEVLGYCLSLLGGTFYLGNIYSAMSAANKYNKDEKEKFKENLLSNVRLDLVETNRGGLLRIKVKF